MDQRALAAGAGAVACTLVVVAILVPYVAVPADQQPVVGAYYRLGAVSPLAVGLLALVGVVAFAAGLRERTDPELVAGLMLVTGVAALLIVLVWALSFGELRTDIATDVRGLLARHRWVLLGATALWAVAAGWYAWTLGLLGGGGRGRS